MKVDALVSELVSEFVNQLVSELVSELVSGESFAILSPQLVEEKMAKGVERIGGRTLQRLDLRQVRVAERK